MVKCMENIERVGRKLVHKGRVVEFYEDTMQMPGGKTVKWDFLHHNGAAAILPVDNDGKLILVKQYRPGPDRIALEIPAGCRNGDESRRDAAIREMSEETGYKSNNVEHLIDIYPTLAYCDEFIEIYVARDLIETDRSLDEDEFVDVVKYDIDELTDMIFKFQIQDSKTIAAILAYKEKYLNKNQKG